MCIRDRVVILAVVGGTSSAKTVSVAEAATGSYADQKIQVSGNVVENSFATEGNVLTFDIYDPNGDITQQLRVRFEGGVSATFGNDVTAICTGKVGEDGVLNASELVTKCPSKYENATNALTDVYKRQKLAFSSIGLLRTFWIRMQMHSEVSLLNQLTR